MKAMTKKQLNRKLFGDDFPDDLLGRAAILSMDEFDSAWDKDLLSGHDLIDLDDAQEEDLVCIDNFIASQMMAYY